MAFKYWHSKNIHFSYYPMKIHSKNDCMCMQFRPKNDKKFDSIFGILIFCYWNICDIDIFDEQIETSPTMEKINAKEGFGGTSGLVTKICQ